MKLRLILCCLALAGAACVPPLPDNDLTRNFDPEDTVMGAIQERGVLRVGIEKEAPPIGSSSGCAVVTNEGTECEVEGFSVEIAEEIAKALDVETSYRFGTGEELLWMVDHDVVDVSFPVIPITEPRVRQHGVSDPYLVAHQMVLVRSNASIEGFGQLTGVEICSFMDEETAVDVGDLADGATMVHGDQTTCLDRLLADEIEAATGPDLLLASALEKGGAEVELVGDQLNTEAYGIFVETGASSWVDYVSNVSEEAQAEGRWEAYFKMWIAPGLGQTLEAPVLTVEEAAALYPKDL